MQKQGLILTPNQLEEIANAVHKKSEVTLRLSKSNINHQGYSLPLTKTQVSKLNDDNAHDIKFSIAQIKYISNKIKKGGILPLAALIPIIASVLGGVGTVAGTVASRVQQAKADKETERHNREIEKQLKEGQGLKLGKKKGKGLRL